MSEIQLLTGITARLCCSDVRWRKINIVKLLRFLQARGESPRGGGFGRPPGCPPAVVNSWLTAAVTAAVGPADLLECCHNQAQKYLIYFRFTMFPLFLRVRLWVMYCLPPTVIVNWLHHCNYKKMQNGNIKVKCKSYMQVVFCCVICDRPRFFFLHSQSLE